MLRTSPQSGAGMGVGGWSGAGGWGMGSGGFGEWTGRNTGLVRSREVTYLGTKETTGSVRRGETTHTERILEA